MLLLVKKVFRRFELKVGCGSRADGVWSGCFQDSAAGWTEFARSGLQQLASETRRKSRPCSCLQATKPQSVSTQRVIFITSSCEIILRVRVRFDQALHHNQYCQRSNVVPVRAHVRIMALSLLEPVRPQTRFAAVLEQKVAARPVRLAHPLPVVVVDQIPLGVL